MEKLDNNALFKVLAKSEPIEVMQLCTVNKKFAKLCKTSGVFGRLLELHFPKDEFSDAYEWFDERKVLDSRNMYIRLTENYGLSYKIRIKVEQYDMYGDLEFEVIVAEDAYKIKVSDINKPLNKFEYKFRVPGFKNLKNGVLIIKEVEIHDPRYRVYIEDPILFFGSMNEAYDWFYEVLISEIARREYGDNEDFDIRGGRYDDSDEDNSDYEYEVFKTKAFLEWLDRYTNIPNIYDKYELFKIVINEKYVQVGSTKYNFLAVNLKS